MFTPRVTGADDLDATAELFRSSGLSLLEAHTKPGSSNDPMYGAAARQVLNIMHSLWRQDKLCDVVLVTSDGALKAHKIALGAYSAPLAEKFRRYAATEMIRINVTDFDSATVGTLLQFLYTVEIDINTDNIASLLRCAMELGVDIIVQLCREYVEHSNIRTALVCYGVSEMAGWQDLVKKIHLLILDNFAELAATDDFPKISPELLAKLIGDNTLRVSCELEVFAAVVRWVDHDRRNRAVHTPALMQLVRLQLISPEDLVTKVEAVDYIFHDLECQRRLSNAYKFHALHCFGSQLAQSYAGLGPRHPRQIPSVGEAARAGEPRRLKEAPKPAVRDSSAANVRPKVPHRSTNQSNQSNQSNSSSSPSGRLSRGPVRQGTSGTSVTPRSKLPQPSSQFPPGSGAGGAVERVNSEHEHDSVTAMVARFDGTNVSNNNEITQGRWRAVEGRGKSVEGRSKSVEGRKKAVEGRKKAVEVRTKPVEVRTKPVEDRPKAVESRTIDVEGRSKAVMSPGVVCPSVVCVGGVNLQDLDSHAPGRSVLRLHPATEEWTYVTSLDSPTHHHGVAAGSDGRLYIIGGCTYDPVHPEQLGQVRNSVDIYDPGLDLWTQGTPMLQCRAYFVLLVDGDVLYAVGGEDENNQSVNTIEQYDCVKDTWTVLTSLRSSGRTGLAAAVYHDYLFVVGGYNKDESQPVLADVDCFDMALLGWTKMSPLSVPRCHANLVVANDQMFLIGGRSRHMQVPSLGAIHVYCEQSDTWDHVADMRIPRHDSGCVVIDSFIFIVGGMMAPCATCLASIECYDVSTAELLSVPELPVPVTGVACCVMNIG